MMLAERYTELSRLSDLSAGIEAVAAAGCEIAFVCADPRSAGAAGTRPPEDHPWGDRVFSLRDPNGVTLYIYSNREPSPDFKSAYLEAAAHE